MKFLFQIILLTIILTGGSFNAHAQMGRNRPASARAAYGDNAPTLRANSKKNKKMKKKASKAAKRKKSSKSKGSYWSGKPF